MPAGLIYLFEELHTAHYSKEGKPMAASVGWQLTGHPMPNERLKAQARKLEELKLKDFKTKWESRIINVSFYKTRMVCTPLV